MGNHEIDSDMVLIIRWMNECIGSFYDEKSKQLFRSADPNSAVPFEWDSASRAQKIDLVGVSPMHSVAGEEEGAMKQMDAYKGEEPCCEPTTDTGEKMVSSTSVEQDDKYWMPCRAFTNCYVNGRAAKVELNPDIEWTMLSYKTYRLIGSEVPLRQAEEILETKTGDNLGAVGKASVVLQLGQFTRTINVLVVDGLDDDLTLGLVWYERNKEFVFDMKNEVLKTGKKCSIPIEVKLRCPGRPRFRVRDGMETGRVCVNAAVTTDSCEA